MRDLKTQYFMETCKTLMQSGKAAVAKGWNTGVDISVFSLENQKKRIAKRRKIMKNAYLFLGKGKKSHGGGVTMKLSMKNGRLYSHRDFQVVCNRMHDVLTHSCFGVVILLAITHLRDPKKFELMQHNNNIEDFITADEIMNVYEKMKLQVSKVDALQFEHAYENFLKSENIDLVIYCDKFFHKIISDTQVEDDGNVLRIDSKVISLWLNSNITNNYNES